MDLQKDKKEKRVNSPQGSCEGKISPHVHLTEIHAKGDIPTWKCTQSPVCVSQEEQAAGMGELWEGVEAEELLSCTLRNEEDFERSEWR